ncbi:MAG: hypothetical protein WD114_02320 [Phycisphaerales bacterium]
MAENLKDNLSNPGAWPWTLVAGFAGAWFIAALYAFSHIEIDMFLGIVAVFAGIMLAVLWIIMTLLEVFVRLRRRESLPLISPRRWLAWLMTPALGCAGLLLAWTDADLLLRLRLSESALAARAEQLLASGETGHVTVNGRLGLFRVDDAGVSDDGTVRFWMQYPGIFMETGLYYDPHRVITDTDAWPEERERLRGPWVKFIFRD